MMFLYRQKTPIFNQALRLVFSGVVLDSERRGSYWKRGLSVGNKKGTRVYHLRSVIFDPRFEEWTRQYDFVMPKAIGDLDYGCEMTGVPITAKPHAKPQGDFLQVLLDIFGQVAPACGAATS